MRDRKQADMALCCFHSVGHLTHTDFETSATDIKYTGVLLCGILSFFNPYFSSALILTPPAGKIIPDSS